MPWTYYLLDGGQRQHAVYEGRYLMTDVSSECDTGAVLYWVPAEYLIHGTGDVPYLSLLPNGDKRYRIQDNLGSTRVVFDDSGAVYSYSSYEPFGKAVDGGGGDIAPDRLSFIGKEQDTESDLGDFGVRKYDNEIGRFLSTDVMWELGRDVHPYQYGHNNPLRRVDKSGKWDVDVHFFHNRSQQPFGMLNVRNNQGEVVFSMIVKGTGVGGHDGTKKNSDTPTGEYDIIGWKTPTEKERKSYGPNPRLVLVGLSGEIAESGRTDIRVHGGRQEVKDANGNWVPLENSKLKDTHGCMRCRDSDVKDMKTVTDALEKNDPNEKPGVLTVTNDIRDPQADQPVDPSKDKK